MSDKAFELALRNIGYWDKLVAGTLTCMSCGRKLEIDTVGAWFVSVESIVFLCNDPDCVQSIVPLEGRNGV